jgi:uncharacterized protein
VSSNSITAEIPASPVSKLSRIQILDVLRGFALLGIFLMNIEWFNRPFLEYGVGIPADVVGIDYMVARGTEVFVSGKFWIIFSMLFGMGFVVMQTQAQQDGRPFHRIYLRRTVALLIFGILHIALLWPGDILHTYALVAFVLMWLPVMSVRISFWLGFLFYSAMGLLTLSAAAVFSIMPQSELGKVTASMADYPEKAARAADIYVNGDYGQITQQRVQDFLHLLPNEPVVFIAALGVFFIGAGLMRSGRLLDLKANRSFFLKMMVLSGIAAVIMMIAAQPFHGNGMMTSKGMLHQSLFLMASLPQSLCYLAVIAYAMSYEVVAKLLGLLAPAGKMALSNYLLQSLVSSLVFFGYGLGMWNQWGRTDLLVFVVFVFIAQLLISHIWLRYFRYGPMEWLWRAITYWNLPPIRMKASEHSA